MIATAMGGGAHDTVPLSLLLYFFHLLIFFIAHVRLLLQGRYELFMTVVCGAARDNAVAGKDVESAPWDDVRQQRFIWG